MIVRTVLAVALAAALLAVSQPAIESASRERTASLLGEEVDRFVDRAESLVDTDDAVARPGGRRIVTLTLPERSRTAAGVEELAIEPDHPENPLDGERNVSALAWTVGEGDLHRHVLDRIRLETPSGEPLRLREPGRHRLVLSLRGSNAKPRVHVERYAGGNHRG